MAVSRVLREVVGVPALRLLAGGGDDDRQAHHRLHRARCAPGLDGQPVQGGDVLRQLRLRGPLEEHALRVPRPDAKPRRRRPGLEDHGRALGGGGGVAVPVHGEVRAGPGDPVDLGRVRVGAAGPVGQHRVVLPGSLEDGVGREQVVLRHGVALVVGDHRPPEVGRGALREAGGHDVPPDPPAREVVEGGEATGVGERRLENRRGGHHEAQLLRGVRHRRHEEHRVEPRQLHRLTGVDVGPGAADLAVAVAVGQEAEVEGGVLQALGGLHPVRQVGVAVGLVLRVRPRRHPAHVEDGGLEEAELDVVVLAAGHGGAPGVLSGWVGCCAGAASGCAQGRRSPRVVSSAYSGILRVVSRQAGCTCARRGAMSRTLGVARRTVNGVPPHPR